jgi:hypothetical protein
MKKKSLFAAASVVALMFGTSAMAQDASFSLVNNSDRELITLQTSGSSDPSWGDDVLSGTAAPGATINVSIGSLEECEYDVRATYDDGDEETLWNIDLCEADTLEFVDDDEDEEDPEEDEDEDDYDDEDEDDYDDEDEDEDDYDDEE